MADGNIRFVLLGTLTEIVADKSPAGLSPAEVRAYVSTNYERFIKVLEPLVPVYSLPRPPIPETRSDRTRANVAALELLARIDGGDQVGDREAANVLGQYTGWGGLSIEENSHRFPDGYEVDPYALAHEFYTPRWLADEIARVLCPIVYDLRDGRGRLNALEPSAGTGRFVDALDRGCPRASLTWTAVEMSPISSAILRRLNPRATVHAGSYESFNAVDRRHGTWNLLVANPPFGARDAVRIFAQQDPDRSYRDIKHDFEYFMHRGLDSLAHRGVGVFVVPWSVLSSPKWRATRARILRRHHLMTAFRLPSVDSQGRKVVEGQLTVMDVLFFRARGGELTEVDPSDEVIVAGEYFSEYPRHVLGDIQTTDQGAFRYTVTGDFRVLPEINERVQCEVCVVARQRRTSGRSGSLTRVVQDLESGPKHDHALWVGERVDRYLAGLASRKPVRGLWRELRDSLMDVAAQLGNPWEDATIQDLFRGGDARAQGLLRAFTRDGSLVDAVRTQPVDSKGYTGRPDDIKAQASWLQRSRGGTLTAEAVHAFHAEHGGTLVGSEIVEALLASGEWFLDGYQWDELVPKSLYLHGELWPRYDRARAQGSEVAQHQARLLLERIGPRTIDEIADIMPTQAWVPLTLVAAWMADTINRPFGEPKLDRTAGLVVTNSELSPEANWCIGWMNHYKSIFTPNEASPATLGIPDDEVPVVVRQQIETADETGEALKVDTRRAIYILKWVRDFNAWLRAHDHRREAIEDAYNRTFRGFAPYEHDASPIEIARWTKEKGLQLKPHQIQVIKSRVATRGGIMGMDVGVGKTFSLLGYVAYGRQEGWIQRPVIVVPVGLVWQWRDEIRRVLPDYRVSVIGQREKTISRGARRGIIVSEPDTSTERTEKWTAFQAGLVDVVLLTDTALGYTQVSDADLKSYVDERKSILHSLRISQESTKRKKNPSERDRALMDAGELYWAHARLSSDKASYDPGILWGDLGIDCLAIDEAGYYRNSWKPQPREFGVPKYMGSPGAGSARAWQIDFRASVVRRHTGGNGILALTGTLGENSPLEIYNIFHLIDPTIFESLGIDDPEQFIDRYLDIDVLAVTDVTGAAEIASAVVGFKNLREMRDILFRWGSFVSARQAGLRLPKARECLAEVDLSATQAARYEDLRQDASKALEKGSTGTAFAAISRMRLVSLHPELEEGYTWTTANGGLARKKVTHEALEHWQARGWRRSLHVLESKMKAAEGIERQQLQSQYATLAAKERKAEEVSVQKLLPPPTSMAAPKLLAVVDRVLATKDCAHIVFVQFTAIHFWLREVLVEAGVERSRIAVINAMEGDIDKVAKAVNGTDDEPPKVDIVIANSKAYRGANFQRRTCAIHNLDLPWTPADLEQRRGRGERQGNLQPVIQIWYYFSRRSFDGFLFSLLVGKAGWQDKLYRSDDDRSTNPQMQLNLDPTQLRRLTAASEAEAEAIEQTLREQAQQRQTAAARKNALAHMQSAITKFAAARSATDSMTRERFETEAEAKLAILSAMSDEFWPWKHLQDRARTEDMLAPVEGNPPLYEGALISFRGQKVQCGRVDLARNRIAVRVAETYRWELQSISQVVTLLDAGQWPAGDDQATDARLQKAIGSQGIEDWRDLGWAYAADDWTERKWRKFGTEVVRDQIGGDVWVPALVSGSLAILRGDDIAEHVEHSIPPTRRGWAVFLDHLAATPVGPRLRRQVAREWFGRELPSQTAAVSGSVPPIPEVKAPGCPNDVLTLRPSHLLDYLDEFWNGMDEEPWTGQPQRISVPGLDGETIGFTIALRGETSKSNLLNLILTYWYRHHWAAVYVADRREAELLRRHSSAAVRAFKSAREHLQASVACLRGLFTVEGARTIDYCVRLDVTGSVVEANNQITRISRVAREGFPKSIQAALDSVGARAEIVEIREAKRLDLRFFGGPGLQGVAVLVRLDTGDLETRTGSWDGAPPWSDRDLDTGHVIELSEKLAIVRAVRDKKEHATAVVHLSRGRFDELAPGPEDLVLAPGELLALAIIQDLSRGTRAREFSAVGLGTYTRSNPYIHRLRDLGLVEIKDSVATTTSAGRRRAAAIDRVAVQREFEAVR